MTFCQSKGDIPYFETSAKEAINIDQAFEGKTLCSVILIKLMIRSDCSQRSRPRRVWGIQRRLWWPDQHPHREWPWWLRLLKDDMGRCWLDVGRFVIVLSEEEGSYPRWWIIDVAWMYHKEAAGFSSISYFSLVFIHGCDLFCLWNYFSILSVIWWWYEMCLSVNVSAARVSRQCLGFTWRCI